MVYSNKQLLNYARFFKKIKDTVLCPADTVQFPQTQSPDTACQRPVSADYKNKKRVDQNINFFDQSIDSRFVDIDISSLKVNSFSLGGSKIKKTRFHYKIQKNKRKKTSFLTPKGVILVQVTKNNTIITLTDLHGKTKYWASAGSCGYKGKQKSSYIITKYVAQKVAKEALALGLNIVLLKMKGTHKPKKLSAISGFIGEKINITKIVNITSLPHNGCRIRRKRRR